MGYDKETRRVNVEKFDFEKFRKLIDEKGIVYEKISQITGLSLRTIDRYIKPCPKDILKESTLRLIVLACGCNYEDCLIEEQLEELVKESQINELDLKPLLDKIDTLIYSNHKDSENLIEKLNQLSTDIHTLGNIQMQTMEYVKDIMNSQAEIKGLVRQIRGKK